MMAKAVKKDNFENHRLRTCLWIVNVLDRHKALTLKEINERWLADEAISGGVEIGRRTFYNYLMAISDLLHVVIECDKRDGFRYKIVAREDDEMMRWLTKSFAVNEVLASNADMRQRILLEDVPSGQEYLTLLMEAMRQSRKITFEYQRFEEGIAHRVKDAEPYCVKLYHQRWYVLVREWRTLLVTHEKVEEMHVYALDRILSLEISDEGFVMDPLFDAKEYFRFAFGTRVEKDNPPCTVRIRVSASQVPYLRTLPLHHTQREVETAAEYSIFELRVALTVELYLQILYYGSLVEVLEPDDLRNIIRVEVHNMAELYGIVEPASPEEIEAIMKDIEHNDPDLYNKKLPKALYAGIEKSEH